MMPALNDSAGMRYFSFFYLYVMQGVPAGFGLTAIANYLIGKGVSSSAVGTFIAVVGIPWIIQFIWGPVIDRYQYSVIGHRKHWVLLPQIVALLASFSLLAVHDPVKQLSLMSLVFFIHSIFASIQDASVDAIAISVVPEDERGRVNAFMRGGYLLGMSLGIAGLSFVLHEYNFHAAALAQSFLLLALTVLTFFIKLDKHDLLLPTFGSKHKAITKQETSEHNPQLKWLFRQLYRGIMQRHSLRLFLVIALVYLCGSIFIYSYTFHLIHELHWPDKQLSILQGSWGSVLTFLVIIGGGVIADRIGATKLQLRVMWAVGIFLLLFNGLYFLWTHEAVTTSGLILWNFADPLFSIAAFPLLMALCIEQVEGSQFTAYMALINFCSVTGSYFAGWALTIIPAPVLGFACGVLIILAIQMLPKKSTVAVAMS